MVAALNDTRCRDEGQLCILLQIIESDNSAVTHSGLDLIKALFHVLVKSSGVCNVGIYALLKGKTVLAAEVVSLPVASAVRSLSPILLNDLSVDVELGRGAFVKACEVATQHKEVGTHCKGKSHMVIVKKTLRYRII